MGLISTILKWFNLIILSPFFDMLQINEIETFNDSLRKVMILNVEFNKKLLWKVSRTA